MFGVPIKFRGRFWLKDDYIETTHKDGELVYGGYARLKFLFDDGEGDYILIDDDKTSAPQALLVYPDSVAQLVGYDANGDEVYEGDKLYYADTDKIVTAQLYSTYYLELYRKVDDND